MHVDPETLVDFAKFLAGRYDVLEPWRVVHGWKYTPAVGDFGGDAGSNDVSFDFEYLTVEEYEKASGEQLDPAYDPGGLGDAGDVGNAMTDIANWEAGLLGEVGVERAEQAHNWYNYYRARGVGQTGTITNGEPYSSGPAPWAEHLIEDWQAAVERRSREVEDVRDEISFLLPKLLGAAEEYGVQDAENATGIELAAYGEAEAETFDRESDVNEAKRRD